MRPPIYSDIETLEAFLVAYNTHKNEAFENDLLHENQHYFHLYNLITKKSALYLEGDAGDFLKKTKENPNFKKMLKDSKIEKFEPQKNDFSVQLPAQTNPHTLFIFEGKEKKECEKLGEKYGLWFYNFEMLFDKNSFLFGTDLFNVTKKKPKNKEIKNEFTAWHDLKKYQHTCNAMVLIDNYILDNTHEIEKNLLPLLDNLLPKKLENQDFDLTIFTDNGKNSILELRHTFLKPKIDNLRPYKINLSIIHINSDQNHDRNVFTNYFWLHSGHSFTYLNKDEKVNKNTNLTLHSLFCNSFSDDLNNPIFNAVRIHLEHVKEHAKTQSETMGLIKCTFGNKENKLFA